MRRVEFLGCAMDIGSMAETVSAIDAGIAQGQFTQHSVVNVAKLVQMRCDASLKAAVESCNIINVDGMGVVWGARFLGLDVPERVSGIDLFHELIGLSADKGYPVFLLGARQEVLDQVVHSLKGRYSSLRIAGAHHGYFWENEEVVVRNIRESGAKLLFVAISSPLKETFIDRWRQALGVRFVMGVGGTFDVVAGKVSRAPLWMQRMGLEWFYRLMQEPGRMWRRYLVTNSRFAWLLLRAKVGLL